MGVLKWVDWTVSEPRYFQLQTDHTPVPLALLDEVGGRRPCLWAGIPCPVGMGPSFRGTRGIATWFPWSPGGVPGGL